MTFNRTASTPRTAVRPAEQISVIRAHSRPFQTNQATTTASSDQTSRATMTRATPIRSARSLIPASARSGFWRMASSITPLLSAIMPTEPATRVTIVIAQNPHVSRQAHLTWAGRVRSAVCDPGGCAEAGVRRRLEARLLTRDRRAPGFPGPRGMHDLPLGAGDAVEPVAGGPRPQHQRRGRDERREESTGHHAGEEQWDGDDGQRDARGSVAFQDMPAQDGGSRRAAGGDHGHDPQQGSGRCRPRDRAPWREARSGTSRRPPAPQLC